MQFFQDNGSKRAIRLVFTGFHNCDFCGRKYHALYHYHNRLVCRKHLPKRAVITTVDKVTQYLLVKIKED